MPYMKETFVYPGGYEEGSGETGAVGSVERGSVVGQ